jgi:hypothetical protein
MIDFMKQSVGFLLTVTLTVLWAVSGYFFYP